MKIVYIVVIVFYFSLGVYNVRSQEYVLDAKKSNLTWTGNAAFNSYSLTGTLKTKEGNISASENEISKLEVVIDMKTLDHENKKLKGHLRSKDFFEVKTYPNASFRIIDVIKVTNEKIVLTGNLSIKGKTNVEEIPVSIERTTQEIVLKFRYSIDRTKYGINHNSPSIFTRMKENAIADEFVLEGMLIFN